MTAISDVKPESAHHLQQDRSHGEETIGPKNGHGMSVPRTQTTRPEGSDNAANTAPKPAVSSQGEARPRPPFKMRRTGHSSMFPLIGRPAPAVPPMQSPNGNQADVPVALSSNHAPAASPRRKRVFVAASDSEESDSALGGPAGDLSVDVDDSDNSGDSEDDEDSVGSEDREDSEDSEDNEDSEGSESSEDSGSSEGDPPATHAAVLTGTVPQPKPFDTTGRDQSMETSPSLAPPESGSSGDGYSESDIASKPARNHDAVQSDTDGLPATEVDPNQYKTWTDEDGNTILTAGALLPAGYQKDDDHAFPWPCPVRSCRRPFPTIDGLGRHFCNSHRATRFNDNLDGTLTDLGPYASTAPGNGRNSQGGSAKPAVIISKKHMSLTESPMIVYDPAAHPPQRAPYRRSGLSTPTLGETDSILSGSPDPAAKSDEKELPLPDSDNPTTFLEMANPDRPYNKWLDPSGELLHTYGALLPDGYQLDTTLPGRPWICPVRSCRRLYKSVQALGHHFRGRHYGCFLNDNLDGTLSVSGSKGDTEPVVISRRPEDKEETVDPTYPVYPHNSKRIRWLKAEPAAARELSGSASGDSLKSQTRLWSYISSHIDGGVSFPTIPELRMLLSLPRARDLAPGWSIAKPLNDKQIFGLIIQTVGEEVRNPCTECRRNGGPFPDCVSPPTHVNHVIAGFTRSSGRACGNCFIRKCSHACSVRQVSRINDPKVWKVNETPQGGPNHGAAEDAVLALSKRRRSTRLSSAADAGPDGDDEDEGLDRDAASVEPLPAPSRPRKLVTLKVPHAARNTRSDEKGAAAASARVEGPPTEKDLHVQDWEMDDGRLLDAAGGPIALSSTYLHSSAAQSVQLTPTAHFHVIPISSGAVHSFSADPSTTRMCSLPSGRLRVKVGHEEFVIGAQGVFKIVPGVACTVTNRSYGDVVLQVTSLSVV